MIFFQLCVAQSYSLKTEKFAFKHDAYPYGQLKNVDIDITLDMDSKKLIVHGDSINEYDFQFLNEQPFENGSIIRLESKYTDNKRCLIVIYKHDTLIESIEFKCVKVSFKYLLASNSAIPEKLFSLASH